MPVSFDDVEIAFDFVSSAMVGMNQAYLDRQSGKVYMHSDLLGDDLGEELPDDLDDERYIEIPHRNELDLGRRLVFQFVDEHLPGDVEQVHRIFSRRGAYGRFKDLLARQGMLDRWHDFSDKAEEAALRQWCAENGVELAG